MPPPRRHRRHILAVVPLSGPLTGIRIFPSRSGLGIQVIENALNHARVHQEAFDAMAFEIPPFVGRHAVYQELLAFDGYFGLATRQEQRTGGEHLPAGNRSVDHGPTIVTWRVRRRRAPRQLPIVDDVWGDSLGISPIALVRGKAGGYRAVSGVSSTPLMLIWQPVGLDGRLGPVLVVTPRLCSPNLATSVFYSTADYDSATQCARTPTPVSPD